MKLIRMSLYVFISSKITFISSLCTVQTNTKLTKRSQNLAAEWSNWIASGQKPAERRIPTVRYLANKARDGDELPKI